MAASGLSRYCLGINLISFCTFLMLMLRNNVDLLSFAATSTEGFVGFYSKHMIVLVPVPAWELGYSLTVSSDAERGNDM